MYTSVNHHLDDNTDIGHEQNNKHGRHWRLQVRMPQEEPPGEGSDTPAVIGGERDHICSRRQTRGEGDSRPHTTSFPAVDRPAPDLGFKTTDRPHQRHDDVHSPFCNLYRVGSWTIFCCYRYREGQIMRTWSQQRTIHMVGILRGICVPVVHHVGNPPTGEALELRP